MDEELTQEDIEQYQESLQTTVRILEDFIAGLKGNSHA